MLLPSPDLGDLRRCETGHGESLGHPDPGRMARDLMRESRGHAGTLDPVQCIFVPFSGAAARVDVLLVALQSYPWITWGTPCRSIWRPPGDARSAPPSRREICTGAPPGPPGRSWSDLIVRTVVPSGSCWISRHSSASASEIRSSASKHIHSSAMSSSPRVRAVFSVSKPLPYGRRRNAVSMIARRYAGSSGFACSSFSSRLSRASFVCLSLTICRVCR